MISVFDEVIDVALLNKSITVTQQEQIDKLMVEIDRLNHKIIELSVLAK
jgi:hypothetical protein